VRLLPGYVEHCGYLGFRQTMPDAQLDDFTLLGRALGRLVMFGEQVAGRLGGARPAVALGPRRGVQAGACFACLRQAAELSRSRDERREQGIGGIRRFGQHPAAVAVQASCVLVVRSDQPSRAACCD
jgi:hypothetical protein